MTKIYVDICHAMSSVYLRPIWYLGSIWLLQMTLDWSETLSRLKVSRHSCFQSHKPHYGSMLYSMLNTING